MEWVRRWVRRRTRPIPRQKARMYHDRLSVVYYMLAWTAAGMAFIKMFGSNHTALPKDLDVHAESKPSVYKSIDMIRRPTDDMEVQIYNMKNFSVVSVENYQGKSFEEQLESYEMRAKEDFFGETEEGSPKLD